MGGYLGAYTQTPTISAPGYLDLLTGTWGYKHNVWDNDVKAPNYQYKNIFCLLKEARPASKIGIFSTWLDNRTKLVGEGKPAAGNVRFDYHADGYELDTVAFRHDKQARYTHAIDDTVTAQAARTLRRLAPDLSWLYLEHTDDVGHRYGDSPQQQQALGGKTEKVKVWATATNNYKTGGTDTYTLLGTVPLGRQRAAFSRVAYPAAFYKIVLEGAHNTVNRWLMPPGPPTP